MAVGSSGVGRAARLLRGFGSGICSNCRQSISKRTYSAAASSDPLNVSSSTTINSTLPAYHIKAGVILSRPPQITRDQTPFEKAFFLYQKRLNERLSLPFTKRFYFSGNNPADIDWKNQIRERKVAARDLGSYNYYSKERWNDEALVGTKYGEPEWVLEQLLKDGEIRTQAEEEGVETANRGLEKPMPRTSAADETNDTKSLNRALQRTLYLLVKGSDGTWALPSANIEGKEGLHEAAERILVQAGGVNMNTWVVGRVPVGHMIYQYSEQIFNKDNNVSFAGEKTFFMKARIMAGKPDLEVNQLGLDDYQWLAKEEIHDVVPPHVWGSIKNMLAMR